MKDASAPVAIFTAAEIGAALGKAPRVVRRALANCSPAGVRVVRNNCTAAYRIADLPASFIAEIDRLRTARHCRNAEDVLRSASAAWSPRLPLARVAPADIAAAQKLQRSLDVCLALPSGTPLAERVRCALPHYTREIGHAVTDRHLAKLITRTLDRDGGARAFSRLEIYLPDSPTERRDMNARAIFSTELFAPLDEALALIADREHPKRDERDFCWISAVRWFAARSQEVGTKKAKRELREYMDQTGAIFGRTTNARRVALDQKLAAPDLAAIRDQRSERSGRRRVAPDWEQNVALFLQWTNQKNGCYAQAFRELYGEDHPDQWRFTEPFRAYYSYKIRKKKSYVPHALRNAIRADIAASKDQKTRAHQTRKPSAHRNWENEIPGAVHTSDDLTLDLYSFDWNEFGDYEWNGRLFDVGRFQLLLMMCEATEFPLQCRLMPWAQWSEDDVLALVQNTWTDPNVGLPSRGALFERGVYNSLAVQRAFSWPEISNQFLAAGIDLELHIARGPKTKVIEGTFNRLHRQLNHLPGYCGNHERHTLPEPLRKFLQSLKRKGQPLKAETDPREMLLSTSDVMREIKMALNRFANEPQNGERMRGISPAEAWRSRWPAGRIVQVMPDSLRYLLATKKSEQTVTHEGICIPTRSQKLYYAGSEILGRFRGEKVEVYLNPKLPESVTVIHRRSDPHGKNAFSVPLSPRLSPHDATPEEMAHQRSIEKAFMKHGRAVDCSFVPPVVATIRNELLGPVELRETGAAIARNDRDAIELKTKRAGIGRKAEDAARQLGVIIPASRMKDVQRVSEDLRRAAELELLIERKEAAKRAAAPKTQ